MLTRALLASVGLVLLAGCQQTTIRDNDETGELGSPMARNRAADVYMQLSTAYLAENKLDEALKNARKAVIVNPKSADGHNLLGVVQQRLGQDGPAEKAYREAIRLDPRNPYALNAFGSFLCGKAEYEEAARMFRQALQNPLYETPWIAFHNAGLCAEQSGNAAVAESEFRSALQKNPRFAPSLLSMARISFNKQSYMSARGYLQRYAQVSAPTAESLWLGVQTEQQLGDEDQVASYRLKLKGLFPDSEQARLIDEAELK